MTLHGRSVSDYMSARAVMERYGCVALLMRILWRPFEPHEERAMVKIKQAILGVAAAAAIALLPTAPAMAAGHAFRPLNPFGIGHGLLGAAVALATLPLVVASNVVAGVSQSVAPNSSPGYAGPAYGYAPPVAYGPRGYSAPRPGYYGRGYYRSGGNSYPRR
jgi:hypothetical protein